MLVDVVLYGGESDLLKLRLDYLQAEHTIVLEGDRHFTGEYKGWSFPDIQNQFPTVTFCPVESARFGDPWQNEFHQRNQAAQCLDALRLPDDAIVGLFDCDEIPDTDLIRQTVDVSAWSMAKHQGSAYWFQHHELTGLSGSWRNLRGGDFAQMRLRRNNVPTVSGGYHLSSFGSLPDTLTKWMTFSHQELRRPNMDDWVTRCWTHGIAIESGVQLMELNDLPADMPDYLLKGNGPTHWYRRRA